MQRAQDLRHQINDEVAETGKQRYEDRSFSPQFDDERSKNYVFIH